MKSRCNFVDKFCNSRLECIVPNLASIVVFDEIANLSKWNTELSKVFFSECVIVVKHNGFDRKLNNYDWWKNLWNTITIDEKSIWMNLTKYWNQLKNLWLFLDDKIKKSKSKNQNQKFMFHTLMIVLCNSFENFSFLSAVTIRLLASNNSTVSSSIYFLKRALPRRLVASFPVTPFFLRNLFSEKKSISH